MPLARAAVLETFNQPLVEKEYSLPDVVEAGAALARTEMAGICGTDVHLWKGELPITLPVILGHETVGRIVELGAGLENDWTGAPLRIGDRVTWTSTSSCGQCYYCAEKNNLLDARNGEPTALVTVRIDHPTSWEVTPNFITFFRGRTFFELPMTCQRNLSLARDVR
jgi:D-arabinose 1-dehydrogenase-like Zn-dependent alcohol dehydrogenase